MYNYSSKREREYLTLSASTEHTIDICDCLCETILNGTFVTGFGTGFGKTNHIVIIDISRNNDLSIEAAMVLSC